MKTKTILLTAVLSLLLAGCASSNETTNTVSDNSVGGNTVVEVETTQEDIFEDTVSGTVMIPVDDAEESTEVNTEVKDGDNTQFFKSALSESEGFFYLPEGFSVSYSDDYTVEIVKEFNDSVSFDYYDEENDITYYDEIVVADFNNVMNTPFVDSVTYTKAQLMNSGYMYVYDLNVNERDFIVAYSPINREEVNTEEPFYECYPKTSICALTVTDDNCPCTVENCTHTEFIEVSCFLNAEMNENDVLFYVESLINNGAFDLVRG